MGRKKYEGIEFRTKTTIEITFSYQGKRRRESIKLKPSPANLRAASIHRGEILAAISKGEFDYAVTFPNSKHAAEFSAQQIETITVETLLVNWLHAKTPTISSSSLKDYRNTINKQLIPRFGELKLDELSRQDIIDWIIEKDVSNKRIGNLLSPLRAALNDAVNDELVDRNILFEWKYKTKEKPKDDPIDPFTAEEQTAILSKLNGHGYNLVKFAFWTGLRTSELCALQWKNIDWNGSRFFVSQAMTQAASEAETTKTKTSKRYVKLLPPALEALKAQKELSFFHESGCVFLNPRTNEPWTGDAPIRRTLWTHALKSAGVRYRYPYQTRHTYASMMLSSGEQPLWVASQLGHNGPEMLNRNYGKWMPSATPDAGSKAVQIFYNNGATKLPQSKRK